MLRGLPQAVDTGPVRQAFVHDAVVAMEAGGDVRAPGAAITVANGPLGLRIGFAPSGQVWGMSLLSPPR